MGLIFDKNVAGLYKSWYHSPQGRKIDGSIEQLIVSLLDPTAGERVLDIGCGTGNHLLYFSRMGLDVSGVDASSYMIDKAKKRLGHRCTLKIGRAENLPFDDNEFDLAVFINTIEFLDDPLQALREAGRVAKRKVFVGVLNSLSLSGLMKSIQGYFGDPLFSRTRCYNLWQVKSLLRMAYGNAPVSWGCIDIWPSFIEETGTFGMHFRDIGHLPFGSFLGISATMIYKIMTDNLPLKDRLKKASQSLVGARTLEDLNRNRGVL